MNDLLRFEIREGGTKNERYFNGSIQRYHFTDALTFYSFDFKAKDHFSMHLKSKSPVISIGINLSPKTDLVLNRNTIDLNIASFSSVMLLNHDLERLSIQCTPQSSYDFLILKIQPDYLNLEQLSFFNDLKNDNVGMNMSQLIGMPNLELCEMARKLKYLDKTSCDNKFIAQGYCHILIGLKMKELLNTSNKLAFLQPFEIQQLKLVSEAIIKNPEIEYSIKALCQRTGLSVSKLQSGFKEMHDCTVTKFIRNQRLEKALDLLKNTNMNVTEIVYSVGLTSRSYFCRIFKKRFKCSPKFYQQKRKQSLLMV
ncbi:helix-turn-helix domain-containing protein [Gelidibacter pelagius]|uniref:Helix-turn-helix transcriptional regulator n=1 Tax=Gelidibacter pelagius TaxID=2819985 RepID=A0ABS3SUN0_9FLAO|nr:AraC family transcriptional regulator [Gelidibacter pelagius]MBO3099051.1 helix-turn-helix transcriptional regulator [Gelidibacter pelagius]